MNNNEAIADLIDEAVRLLETDGWTKGTYLDFATNARCAVGSLRRAALNIRPAVANPRDSPLYEKAVYAVAAQCPIPEAPVLALKASPENIVIEFNDSQSSPEPVIDLMQHASKDLRNEAGEVKP
jgi:hypothetical protein